MFPVESYTRKKKGINPLLLIIPVIVIGAGVTIYFAAPTLYYRFLGNEVHRIKSRADLFEERYATERNSSRDLYLYIEDSRKIIENLKEDKPALYLGHYYGALFDYYELLLRVTLNGESLLNLVSRGYLPLDEGIPDTEVTRDIPTLAKDMATQMRRAIALKPDMIERPDARLIVAFGDLFYSGRTDPYLIRILEGGGEQSYRDFIQPRSDWMFIILYTYLEKKDQLEALVEDLRAYREAGQLAQSARTDELTSSEIQSQGVESDEATARLDLSPLELNLIHAYGLYYTRDYMRSLMMARSVNNAPEASENLKISATRLEGEIFLKQRGALHALRYFERAVELSQGKDEFMKERLASVRAEAGL